MLIKCEVLNIVTQTVHLFSKLPGRHSASESLLTPEMAYMRPSTLRGISATDSDTKCLQFPVTRLSLPVGYMGETL